MSRKTILQYYDLSKAIKLSCDASLGSSFINEWLPVADASRATTEQAYMDQSLKEKLWQSLMLVNVFINR